MVWRTRRSHGIADATLERFPDPDANPDGNDKGNENAGSQRVGVDQIFGKGGKEYLQQVDGAGSEAEGDSQAVLSGFQNSGSKIKMRVTKTCRSNRFAATTPNSRRAHAALLFV